MVFTTDTQCKANRDGQASSNGAVIAQNWALLLVDEGHTITTISDAASPTTFQRQLFSVARIGFRAFLTGTPVVDVIERQYTILRSAGSAHFRT